MFRTVALSILIHTSVCYAANILGVFHYPKKDHHVLGQTLLKELAIKGHNVTMLSAFEEISTVNYKVIYLSGLAQEKQKLESLLPNDRNAITDLHPLMNLAEYFTERALTHPETLNLLRFKSTFDVIILDWFMNDANLVFGYVFAAPVVLLAPYGTNFLNSVGNPAPFAYVPIIGLPLTDRMGFFQRLRNTINGLYYEYQINWKNQAVQDEILKKVLKNPPSVNELRKQIALVMSNGHFSFESPRPVVPNVIPIGGFHVQRPKELPQELKAFLDDATQGAIYFNLEPHLLSQSQLDDLFQSLSQLPLRVIAKWDAEEDSTFPNIKTGQLLPRNDILGEHCALQCTNFSKSFVAHPKVKLLVSHCDIFSAIEATHHGVPVICVPWFGEQNSLAAVLVANGVGSEISMTGLTGNKLVIAVGEILSNSSYSYNARMRSRLLKNQAVPPLSHAMFWIEHVVEFKGAAHLKNAGMELALYQHFLLDIVVFMSAIAVVTILILCKTFRIVLKMFRRKKEKRYSIVPEHKIKKSV
ncbi:UDP-glucuronosyltransferase [Rhyzopertha dominica]|nr:UDP-glucuronosyltransferase [Rhyzopertha dominica]